MERKSGAVVVPFHAPRCRAHPAWQSALSAVEGAPALAVPCGTPSLRHAERLLRGELIGQRQEPGDEAREVGLDPAPHGGIARQQIGDAFDIQLKAVDVPHHVAKGQVFAQAFHRICGKNGRPAGPGGAHPLQQAPMPIKPARGAPLSSETSVWKIRSHPV